MHYTVFRVAQNVFSKTSITIIVSQVHPAGLHHGSLVQRDRIHRSTSHLSHTKVGENRGALAEGKPRINRKRKKPTQYNGSQQPRHSEQEEKTVTVVA